MTSITLWRNFAHVILKICLGESYNTCSTGRIFVVGSRETNRNYNHTTINRPAGISSGVRHRLYLSPMLTIAACQALHLPAFLACNINAASHSTAPQIAAARRLDTDSVMKQQPGST